MPFAVFPHIEGLKHLERKLRNGYDDMPSSLTFRGTVKLHGTNAAIGQSVRGGELFAQSRSRLLDIETDNYGFAAFVAAGSKGDASKLHALLERARAALPTEQAEGPVHLFGEWAGRGVQKAVAISTLPKFFAVFAVMAGGVFFELAAFRDLHDASACVYNVLQFGEHLVDVVREDAFAASAVLKKVTERVCEACPAGAFLGAPGRGEGLVWTCINRPQDADLWFKTKGEDFTATAPKLASDTPLEVAALRFAEATLAPWRLEQAEAFARERVGHAKSRIPAIIQWAVEDALREEGADVPPDALSAYRRALQRLARAWAVQRCNE